MIAAARVQVVAPDGVRFIEIAQNFAQGDFGSALDNDYHPLYPLLIALVRPVAGGFESAALALSVLFSTLTLLPLYFWIRNGFGRPAALTAAAVFTFIPPMVRIGADTLSEASFHFFVLLSLCLAASALNRGGIVKALLSGLAASLAYLTRQEGMGVLLATGLYTAFLLAAGLPDRRRVLTALTGIAILAGFLAPALPYLIHIRLETGKWDFSRKKSLPNFAKTVEEKYEGREGEKPPDVQRIGIGKSFTVIGRKVGRDLYFIPALFALAGLFIPLRLVPRRWRWEALFLIACAIWITVCFLLIRTHGYLSHRHVMPVALFLLGYAGRGANLLAVSLGPRLSPLLRRFEGGPVAAGPAGVLVGLAAVAFLTGLVENLKAYRWDKVYEKEIGREIASWEGMGNGCMGDRPRISYYAGVRHITVPFRASPDDVRSLATREGACILVLEEAHLRDWSPDLLRLLQRGTALPEGFTALKSWRGGIGGKHLVTAYRIAPKS
jgi:4-amino-4-deoxy-L-arabinose transferase-like glycosyltransferase